MKSSAAKRPRRLIILAGVAGVVVLAALAVVLLGGSDDEPAPRPIPDIRAEGLIRTALYESPQNPGYTSWTGAWLMPDGSVMAAFDEATGPVDPARRTLAPQRVVRAFGRTSWDPSNDFWGLALKLRYMRSQDDGKTWSTVRVDPYRALIPHGYTPQATIALRDGSILRRVNGDDLRHDRDIPHTAYLQRLAPGAKAWTEPQVLLDPARFTYQLSRLRRLRDGRLIATGNVWKVPASTLPPDRREVASTFLLLVSTDEGRTWKNAMTIPPDVGYLPGNEWDTAELPSGDLLAVMRTKDDPRDPAEIRKQAILRRDGDGWVLTRLREMPLPPSGHPELLTTREGPILHIATTGVHYTKDGVIWTPLAFPKGAAYRTRYYPRAVQTPDGTVLVVSHAGGDDFYGERDQAITLDRFRIVPEPEPSS